MRIKPISDTFRKNGFDFRLLKKDGGIAIFELSKKKVVYGYEVHKLRIFAYPPHLTGDFMGCSHYERLASREDFGRYAWSFNSLKKAKEKFAEVAK